MTNSEKVLENWNSLKGKLITKLRQKSLESDENFFKAVLAEVKLMAGVYEDTTTINVSKEQLIEHLKYFRQEYWKLKGGMPPRIC